MAIDMDVSKFPVLKAGLIVVGVIMGRGYVMVTTCPPDLSASKGVMFFLSQGR